jgi:hypothetical protein
LHNKRAENYRTSDNNSELRLTKLYFNRVSHILTGKSRDNSVLIANGYELDDRVSNSDRGKIFLLHDVQAGSGTHLVSYPMGTGSYFT